MKLWQKDNKGKKKSESLTKRVEEFTVGSDREMDLLLAEFDVVGSIAHITMLQHVGLLTKEELKALRGGLVDIYKEIKDKKFKIERGVEDVHSQVELLLTRRLGEAGKKIHSGRSRNDQVLLDLKLFMRREIAMTVRVVKGLFDKLISLSEKHKEALLPGYTHFQVAMPSSFGLWFGAYAESLVDDLNMMQAAYRITNKNPLGSAAGYGSSFPLNRQMTTDLLGFESLNYNVVYAQMGRGKTERNVASALASIAATLGKMAMDICLYMSQNFGFVSFPDELTTGSSIMPHKKNPDVFELIRARCNKIQSLPNEIALLTTNLPSGYHRDMQVIKENFLPAFRELNNCVQMATFMLTHIRISEEAVKHAIYKHLFSVEEVNRQVVMGVPFRDAYKKIAAQIAEGTLPPPSKVKHTHEGSIGNLCNDKIVKLMDKVMKEFHFEKMEAAMKSLVR